MKYLIQKKTGINLIEVEFNSQDSNIGNNVIKYDYEDKSISKNIEIRSSMVTIRFLDKELNRVSLERNVKIGTLFETDIYTTGTNSLILDHNGMAIGFKISDGRLGKDGLHKEYFSRVINEDTDIECEMLRFDHYFNGIPTKTEILNILTENNNDLSQIVIGFKDETRYLNSLFDGMPLTASPRMIVGRNVESLIELFDECRSIKYIHDKLFYYCKEVTNLDYCFRNCEKLEAIQSGLFMNNSNVNSISYLFQYCKLITEIPSKLFDSFTKVDSAFYTFADCENLKIIPNGLFNNCINLEDVSNCFIYSSISEIPYDLFYNCINIRYVDYCFYGCELLTSIPSGLFDKNINITSFKACFCYSGVESIPESIFYNNLKARDFSWCFSRCPITEIPPSLFAKNINATDFRICFGVCENLTKIPQGLFDKNINVTNFRSLFWDCTSLVTTPFNLFDNNINTTDFAGCFDGCLAVTSALPDVWNKEKFPNVSNGSRYALGCTKAANYAEIPSNFK